MFAGLHVCYVPVNFGKVYMLKRNITCIPYQYYVMMYTILMCYVGTYTVCTKCTVYSIVTLLIRTSPVMYAA